jgi:Mitochondrial carrier protein
VRLHPLYGVVHDDECVCSISSLPISTQSWGHFRQASLQQEYCRSFRSFLIIAAPESPVLVPCSALMSSASVDRAASAADDLVHVRSLPARPTTPVQRHPQFQHTVVAASSTDSAWDARLTGPIPHTPLYYAKCAIGGALACGPTHAVVTPLDVAKCNAQVDPAKYRALGSSLRIIAAEEGARGLYKGWLPALIGYSMQGTLKYSLYEYFKDSYANLAGREAAASHRGLIWCGAAASAEVFADLAMCPMEMLKVKVQTAPHETPVFRWDLSFLSGPVKYPTRSPSFFVLKRPCRCSTRMSSPDPKSRILKELSLGTYSLSCIARTVFRL